MNARRPSDWLCRRRRLILLLALMPLTACSQTPSARDNTAASPGPPRVRAPRPKAGTPEAKAFELVATLRRMSTSYRKQRAERWRRWDAIKRELAELGAPAAPVLEETLMMRVGHDAPWETHGCAASALVQMGAVGAPHLARAVMYSPQSGLAGRAAARLEDGTEHVLPAVTEMFHRWDFPMRRSVCQDIGERGPAASSAWPLLAGAVADHHWSVRREALEALAKIGPGAHSAAPALIKALSHPDPHTQLLAAAALAAVDPVDGSKQATSVLVRSVADEGLLAGTRSRAVRELARLTPPVAGAEAALLRALGLRDRVPCDLEAAQLRCDAAWALGELRIVSAAATAALQAATRDTYQEVRETAAGALRRAKQPDVQRTTPAASRRRRRKQRPTPGPAAEAARRRARELLAEVKEVVSAPRTPQTGPTSGDIEDALVRLGPAAVPALIDMVRDDDDGLSDRALMVLYHMDRACRDAWPTLATTTAWRRGREPSLAIQALTYARTVTSGMAPGAAAIIASTISGGAELAATEILVVTARRYPDRTFPLLKTGLLHVDTGPASRPRILRDVVPKLGPVATPLVPALKTLLDDRELDDRLWTMKVAAQALGAIGLGAKDAVRSLKDARTGLQRVEQALTEAIERIEGGGK